MGLMFSLTLGVILTKKKSHVLHTFQKLDSVVENFE
jgi:hypothetical protein